METSTGHPRLHARRATETRYNHKPARTALVCLAVVTLCCACATTRITGLASEVRYCLSMVDDEVAAEVPALRGLEHARDKHRRLELDLFYPPFEPKDGAAYPLVVHVHGGGWRTGRRSSGGGVPEVEALTEQGYAVASIDYRLAPDNSFPAPLADLRRALQFLAAEADALRIHAGKVGLLGTSSGAHIAMLYLCADPQLYGASNGPEGTTPCEVVALADLWGPSDIEALTVGVWRAIGPSIFGPAGPRRENYRVWSPAQRVSASWPATLVVHGDRDTLVPPEQSEVLVRNLLDAGVPTDYVVVSNAGHALRPVQGEPTPCRDSVTDTVVAFFKTYLGGTVRGDMEPGPSPL